MWFCTKGVCVGAPQQGFRWHNEAYKLENVETSSGCIDASLWRAVLYHMYIQKAEQQEN